MQLGTTFTLRRVLTQDDFNRFAALSGDNNPIHVDPAFSARTAFGKTVAHGMFLYSLVCGLLATHFGNASQITQDLMFPNPSYVGEEVTVSLKVVEIKDSEARLETIVSKPSGEIGLQGETTIRWMAA
ncbi:MAG: hypothetical protein A2Z03_06595 [Chloroflexi bacterium RBG_16_56_8]|nr:MAG: hypothetical protein A2Z03_06595 [Chloroflexi bacterium RBG_16_56_8]